MGERIRDMTRGKPLGLILGFAIPLMLGNVFQQLYTMVDAIIVGKGIGVQALAAVGAAEWPNWLITGLVIGFSQGFSIQISQRFGAEDFKGLRRAVTMSVELTGILAVFFTALSLSCAGPVLSFLQTPEDVYRPALMYLCIICGGIPIIMGYNVLACILRALGDSRTPLSAMVLAACANVGLDLLFVLGFRWGVAGAAAATVAAQLCSCVFCLIAVKRISVLKTEKSDWKPDFRVMGELLKLGCPTAFQNGIIGAGGLGVQYVINGYGMLFMAGFTATNKLYGILEIAASSFGYSLTTYVGQNLGARRLDRIKSGMRTGLLLCLATSVAIAVIMLIFGRQVLSLFISGTPEEVKEVGDISYHYLFNMCICLPILYLLWVYRSALMGLGDTVIPMVSGIMELAMRLLMVMAMPALMGMEAIFYAEPAAWLGAAVLLCAAYYIRYHRIARKAR